MARHSAQCIVAQVFGRYQWYIVSVIAFSFRISINAHHSECLPSASVRFEKAFFLNTQALISVHGLLDVWRQSSFFINLKRFHCFCMWIMHLIVFFDLFSAHWPISHFWFSSVILLSLISSTSFTWSIKWVLMKEGRTHLFTALNF